jgi:hypothetical protein
VGSDSMTCGESVYWASGGFTGHDWRLSNCGSGAGMAASMALRLRSTAPISPPLAEVPGPPHQDPTIFGTFQHSAGIQIR